MLLKIGTEYQVLLLEMKIKMIKDKAQDFIHVTLWKNQSQFFLTVQPVRKASN